MPDASKLYLCIHDIYTDNQESWWYQLCYHWWHQRLSWWQSPVSPVLEKLVSWSLLLFGVSDFQFWLIGVCISFNITNLQIYYRSDGNFKRGTIFLVIICDDSPPWGTLISCPWPRLRPTAFLQTLHLPWPQDQVLMTLPWTWPHPAREDLGPQKRAPHRQTWISWPLAMRIGPHYPRLGLTRTNGP